MSVRTRFAPSPTGVLHLGSIRTALYCWLFAHHHEGQFVLRIEDTDRERSTPENVDAILEGLDWLGLTADEGPYYQTDRYDRYRSVIEAWLNTGKAYHCYCTREELAELRERQLESGSMVGYDGRCRERAVPRQGVDPVVRFRNPDVGQVVVNDHVRGRVSFENSQLDDLVIARSDGSPTYNFCVVVDDYDMKISHVIRGDEHLNNTPRQLNLFAALEVEPPEYAHIPMILGPDGSKLSKRHGAVDIRDYREQGYLPEAMLNFLVRLGWSHGDQELFDVQEMIRFFDIDGINRSASSFNPDKLLWINQQHIIRADSERLGRDLIACLDRLGIDYSTGPDPVDVAEVYRERAETLMKMAESARYCYEEFREYEPRAAAKQLRPVMLEPFRALGRRFGACTDWSRTEILAAIDEVSAEFGMKMGKLGQPLRVAVTGGPASPPIDATLWLVGKERTVQRLDAAIAYIEARSNAAGAPA